MGYDFYLSKLGEKRLADMERFTLQALNLAEAGANHGVSELRKRYEKKIDLPAPSLIEEPVIEEEKTPQIPEIESETEPPLPEGEPLIN